MRLSRDPGRVPAETQGSAGVPPAFAALLIVLVVLKATAYWWGSWLAWPEDPLSVLAMYRGQDIEAFPIISGLTRFNAGEAGVLEWLGFGTSPRIAPYLLHSVLLGLAGPAGFMIGDVLISVAAYLVLARLFQLSGVGPVLARATAVLLVCLTANDFGEPGFGVAGIEYLFWGLRIPRPFVSDLFMFTVLVGALTVVAQLRAGTRPGPGALAAVGIGGALLLQSDVFTAAGLGLGLVGGVILLALFGPGPRPVLLRSVGIAGGWAVLGSVPLFVDMARMRPDLAQRLGLFPVSRLAPPFLFDGRLILALLVLVIMALVLRAVDRAGARATESLHARWLFCFLAAGALFALPASSLVLGNATQVYHYPLALIRALWLAAIVLALQAAQLAADRLRLVLDRRASAAGRRPPFVAFATALVLGPCLLSAWRLAGEGSRKPNHMRTDVAEYAELADYRSQFVSLLERLPASSRSEPVVLATFDHQLWSWWLTFGNGYSYLADACTTTLPDAEIEHRLVSLARLIGMTHEQFLSFVRRRFVLSFWHSCARFQASTLYTYGPGDDYREADRRRIEQTRATDSFSLILPLSEERRLGRLFDDADASDARLDLIVLTKNEFLDGLGPPAGMFEPVYDNAVFSMWRRRR